MKPGIKTTEFWGSAIVTLVGLAVGSGMIDPELGQRLTDTTNQASTIIAVIIDGLIQLIGLVGAFYIQYRRGKERTELKKQQTECDATRP